MLNGVCGCRARCTAGFLSFLHFGKKRKGGKTGKCDGWMSVIPRQLFSTESADAKSASAQPHPWVDAAKCLGATHTHSHTHREAAPTASGRRKDGKAIKH